MKLKILVVSLLLASAAAAQDISISTGIVGSNQFLGAKTPSNQATVPVLGIDSGNDTVVNSLSGENIEFAAGGTTYATLTSTTANFPSLTTTYEAVAAAGSTVADAGALSGTKFVHQVTGADGTKGVKFVTATPVGSIQIILNTTAGVLKVYGESGSTVNGGSADAAFTALTGVKPIICIKTAALTYICS